MNCYDQGSPVSATARCSFVGESQLADFVDLQTSARFRVRMVVQGRELPTERPVA